MDTATPRGPELVIGLIGALGSPLEEVMTALERVLDRVGYKSTQIRLSDSFSELGDDLKIDTRGDAGVQLTQKMDAGTKLRKLAGHGKPMAWLAVSRIRDARNGQPTLNRHAFIVRQLKHPDEVAELRAVYGDHFVAIGIYAPHEERIDRLARRFADESAGRADQHRARAMELIATDERESGTALGQNVRKTFPEADLFVTGAGSETQPTRFVELFFGKPVVTPRPDEVGMFHAHAAALRSAALGRQVGAAIMTRDGDVLATGCNEVPRAGGGQYWEDDAGDGRDFQLGHDESDRGKRHILSELLRVLADAGHLSEKADVDQLVGQLLSREEPPPLPETSVANLTEFTRDVHAEGAALVTAARLGTAVRGSILYATTFPCHNCAKHIVAAGVDRVVYREPYPKSYAREFYRDSIEVDGEKAKRVSFVPFIGVAPRRYLDWFAARKRKEADGRVAKWRPHAAYPAFFRHGIDPTYPQRELVALDDLAAVLANMKKGAAVATSSVESPSGGRTEP